MLSSVKSMSTPMRRFTEVTASEAQQFSFHPRNRMIDRKHLQDIKKQMEKSFSTMPAITVNILTKHVVDGQHRLEAFKQLEEEGKLHCNAKLPVMFIEIPPENELGAIIDANINSKSWAPYDYIHSYIKDGNQNYITLDDWCKTHSLTANIKDPSRPKYRYGAVMMKGVTARVELAKGQFTVTEEQLNSAHQMHNESVKLIELFGLPFAGQWVEPMLISWYKYRNLDKFSSVVSYMKRHIGGLKKLPKGTVSDWDSIFAKIHSGLDFKSNKVA